MRPTELQYDILIVGAGHAGAATAIALRQPKLERSIALLGDEPELPYQRPPLSKDYSSGDKAFERILIAFDLLGRTRPCQAAYPQDRRSRCRFSDGEHQQMGNVQLCCDDQGEGGFSETPAERSSIYIAKRDLDAITRVPFSSHAAQSTGFRAAGTR